MIRVLVCDDSVVIRQVVTDALKSDPGIQVVGVAQNGRVALEKIPDCRPDVMTLDLEMPEMDGLTTLAELGKRRSKLPVVVFSTLTERGASATRDALARGASDYVCKPSGQRNLQQTMETIRAELIPKIYALSGKSRGGGAAPRPAPQIKAPAGPFAPVNVIVIGVSTGGPGALQEVVPRLPAGLQQPVLIVQHMPPVFTKVLAQRLAQASPLKVKEAEHQERLAPGRVLIAPGNFHMRIAGSPRDAWVTLDQNPQENGCRPAVDPLFVSAAQVFGGGVLALVMTGLGRDGTKGAGAVRKLNGQVWVQDEPSSTVWGMPGSVVEAGLALRVIPLQNIARAIGEVTRAAGGSHSNAAGPKR
jgi:two-component system chemotaxis response regulator CheB